MHPENEAASTARQGEVPSEARELAETLSQDHEQRRNKAAAALEHAIANIAERARAKIHDQMGSDTRRAVQDFKRRERLALQERMQPPLGAGVTFYDANRLRKANVDTFLH